MTSLPTDPETASAPRGEQRRQQVLDAAAACFAREGFHGASIARIGREAGMSPGHIYHFFASKEDIVAALVARKLDDSLAMVEQFEHADDVFQAMLDRVDTGLRERTDPGQAALELEMLAEAARNPRVAELMRAADAIRRERLRAVLRQARQACGQGRDAAAAVDAADAADPGAVTEVLMAMFEGLAMRAVNHPELDREALAPVLRAVLRSLIRGTTHST